MSEDFTREKTDSTRPDGRQDCMNPETQPSAFLWSGFLRSVERFPDRPAVEVAGCEISYRRLAERAKRIAAAIQSSRTVEALPLTAVFCYRSEMAYAGVLGALLAGDGYVPLNRTFPVERTKLMLERSECVSVIVDADSERQLEAILPGCARRMTVICPDRAETRDLISKFPTHCFVGGNDLPPAENWRLPEVSREAIAYLLFTSGSTGQPKGVMVSHRNVLHYLDFVIARYGFHSEDRLSQTFDLTFDLSVHDMFVAWHSGACVCCPSQKQMIKPGPFINDSRLTAWFSVPSTAVFMRRLGGLKSDLYPRLRISLFCGEALPMAVARQWSLAAPNSVLENIYGPTELTIACTAYRWDRETSESECENGLVPIGTPFGGMRALIVDEQLQETTEGELIMTGPQLTLGYWRDPEKTNAAFVPVPGREELYYRTGDRVRVATSKKTLLYLGRLDSQIKVLGHRVELGEVEAAVRAASGVDGVVAIGWPASGATADGIEVFLQSEECDAKAILQRLKETLPSYMVPRQIRKRKQFPLNSNGKFDRKELINSLEDTYESA